MEGHQWITSGLSRLEIRVKVFGFQSVAVTSVTNFVIELLTINKYEKNNNHFNCNCESGIL